MYFAAYFPYLIPETLAIAVHYEDYCVRLPHVPVIGFTVLCETMDLFRVIVYILSHSGYLPLFFMDLI